MSPLTDLLPKALFPALESDIIGRLIVSLRQAGIDDCLVGVGWKKEMVIRRALEIRGANPIQTVEVANWETGALRTLVTVLNRLNDATAIVCPADCITTVEMLSDTLRLHHAARATGQVVTLAVDEAVRQNPNVYADSHGRLLGVGKSIPGARPLGRSAMLLVIERAFMDACSRYLDYGCTSVQDSINRFASEGGIVGAAMVHGPWYDVDTIGSLLAANRGLLSGDGTTCPECMYVSEGDSYHAETATTGPGGIKIGVGVKIQGPCLLTGGTRVSRDCALGPSVLTRAGTKIGHSCSIRNAILFGNSVVPPRSVLDGVVVYQGVPYTE
jgi:NDP-sugar pyrophosphorylase family protein